MAADDGSVVNVAPDARLPGLRSLAAFVPYPASTCCFFLSDIIGCNKLRINNQTSVGPIAPLRHLRLPLAGISHFYSPENGAFLCAAPIDPVTQSGPLALAPNTPREYERFTLKRVPDDNLSETMRAQAHALTLLNEPDPDARSLAGMITLEHPPQEARDALNAAGFLLPWSQIDQLAMLLMRDSQAAANGLQAIFQGDVYASYALPQLLHWLSVEKHKPESRTTPGAKPLMTGAAARSSLLQRLLGRSPPNAAAKKAHSDEGGAPSDASSSGRMRQAIGTSLDCLDEDALDGKYISLPFAINTRLRRSAEPNRRACIIASARNEGLYIVEWLAYHKAIGFDHIFLYSNNNTDGSDDLLRALSEAGEITWIDNTVGAGRRAQWKAYGHALRVMPDALDFEWSLLIDLDEFFVPNPLFGSVGSFLDWHETQSVDAIGINWRFVGSNEQTHWRDEPLSRRCPLAINDANPHIKSMFRTKKFIHSFAHDPANVRDEHVAFKNASRSTHLFDPANSRGLSLNPDASMASIVHFFYKSNEEFVWKSSRNRGDHACQSRLDLVGLDTNFINDFIETAGAGSIPTGMAAYEHVAAKQLTKYLVYSDVTTALEKIKESYLSQIPALIDQAAVHPAMVAAGRSGVLFMKPLSQVSGIRGRVLG